MGAPRTGRRSRSGRGTERAPRPACPSRSRAAAPRTILRAPARAGGALGQRHVLRAAVVRGREIAPLEGALLAVVLPERDRKLRLHQLASEVERVRRLIHAEPGEQLMDVRAPDEQLAVEYGDGVPVGEDAEIGIGDRGLELAQLTL